MKHEQLFQMDPNASLMTKHVIKKLNRFKKKLKVHLFSSL